MASFALYLIGMSQPVVIEAEHPNVASFVAELSCKRFVVGWLMEPDHLGAAREIAIATNRIVSLSEIS